MMLSEIGNFFLAMTVGFGAVQVLASWWCTKLEKRVSPPRKRGSRAIIHCEAMIASLLSSGKSCLSWVPAFAVMTPVVRGNYDKYCKLGRVATFLQGGFLMAAFFTLITAFVLCDFSILTVALHDHRALPWFYRLAATWGNHEGSLLLFVLILSGMGVALAMVLKDPHFRARTLTIQGLLTLSFLTFLIITSNPFTPLPYTLPEGESLNPLLQDRGLLFHPPLLYLGYVGFSSPYALAIAALWGKEDGARWETIVRPWVLFAWGALTAGITLGSWWAYYELGWGGWWFWDPVENASLMPWLAGTALLHTLRTGKLYRWSLLLSLLTFGLSLLGTFLVRSGLITSVHSFAQSSERGLLILSLLGAIMGFAFFMWTWRAPRYQSQRLELYTRQGALILNSLLLCVGLGTIFLGTLYPLWSEWVWGVTLAIGTPYFERTFIPLMIPLLILIPIGSLLRNEQEPLFPLLITPLTAALGTLVIILFAFSPASLWAIVGITVSGWVFIGTLMAFFKKRLSLGPTLAHVGVAISLLGVSVGGGYRMDEAQILGLQEKMTVGGTELTLQSIQQGKESTFLFEKAILSYPGGFLTPEKRLYKPQNSLLSETAITTNGFRDLYAILGPYQGENRWLIRGSVIPLAPWIWAGGAFMVLGACISFFRCKSALILLLLLLPFSTQAEGDIDKRARTLAQEIRCPVCLGQSIYDSDTDASEAIRLYIMDELSTGRSEEEIRKKLRENFGDEVLFRPPFEGHTFFLWIAPFGLFFLILAWFLWRLYRNLERD